MKVITIEHPKLQNPLRLHFSVKQMSIAFGLAFMLIILLTSWLTYKFVSYGHIKEQSAMHNHWQNYLSVDYQELQSFKHKTEQQLDVVSHHVGRLSANLVRLNALGERLIEQANLDPNEFNFTEEPGMGGPLEGDLQAGQDIIQTLLDLEQLLDKRFNQFSFLDDFFQELKQKDAMTLSGRGKPLRKGWVSSFFGKRTDPFTGKKAWHSGVDIAGREGDEVLAVASGIVSLSADKGSYGKLVEINHGNDLTTRYAHNKESLVKVGDLVKKGDPIALVGKTGRATGPHVHLEVRKKDKAVDPGLYFHDLRRKKA